MKHLLLVLPLLALATSCVAAAAGAGAAGYLAYREGGNTPTEIYIERDVAVVTEGTLEALDILHDVGTTVTTPEGSIAVREGATSTRPRAYLAQIDDHEIAVQIEAYDLNKTLVRVEAQTKLTGDEQAVARRVLDEIVKRTAALAR